MIIKRRPANQQGFTIVELLIAMTVFSIILLVCLVGIVQIGRYFYKGVTITRTQNTARTTIDTVSQSIQFSDVTPLSAGTHPTSGFTSYCVGTKRYSFRRGRMLVKSAPSATQTTQALIVDDGGNPTSCPQSNGTFTNPRELLTINMRVSNFEMTRVGTTNLWQLNLTIAFGDDQTLGGAAAATGVAPKCQGALAGTQFCTVTTLNTTVVKRL